MQPWPPNAGPPPPPMPPARSGGRPTIVTAAAMLLMVTVVLCLAQIALVTVGLVRQVQDAKNNSNGDDVTFLTVGFIVLIGLSVVAAIGMSAGALGVLRGRPAGRVISWIFGILTMVLCCGCGGVGLLGFVTSERDKLSNPFPNWLFIADASVNMVIVAVVLVAMILLTPGTSSRYFRSRR